MAEQERATSSSGMLSLWLFCRLATWSKPTAGASAVRLVGHGCGHLCRSTLHFGTFQERLHRGIILAFDAVWTSSPSLSDSCLSRIGAQGNEHLSALLYRPESRRNRNSILILELQNTKPANVAKLAKSFSDDLFARHQAKSKKSKSEKSQKVRTVKKSKNEKSQKVKKR